MKDIHTKHIHTGAHWGQAFEPDVVKDVVIEQTLSAEDLTKEGTSATDTVAKPARPSGSGEALAPQGKHDEIVVLPFEDQSHLEGLYTEGLALLKLEDTSLKGYLKNLFKKHPRYEIVGKVFTQAGRELAVVINQKGEKFARYDIYGKSTSREKPSPMRSAYLSYKKVEAYLRK